MAPTGPRASGSCGGLLAARSTDQHPIGSLRKTQGVWGPAPMAAWLSGRQTQLTIGATGLHSQPLSMKAGSNLDLPDVPKLAGLHIRIAHRDQIAVFASF